MYRSVLCRPQDGPAASSQHDYEERALRVKYFRAKKRKKTSEHATINYTTLYKIKIEYNALNFSALGENFSFFSKFG